MRTLLLLCYFFILTQISAQEVNPTYDPVLADSLGADDYGMKAYTLVLLRTGTNTTADKEFVDSCFAGHMSNMNTMVEQSQLIVAGPIGQNEHHYRGIFILNIADADSAAAVLQTDPAIDANLLEPIILPWYGSAALPVYLEASETVSKFKF